MGPGPYWTPSDQEVRFLEAALPGFLAVHWPSDRPPFFGLAEYKRQYFGITRGGFRFVFVNAFCREFWSRHPDWASNSVIVQDGGSCYFQVLYNPTTRAFLNLWVNGVALTPPNKRLQLTAAGGGVRGGKPPAAGSLASGAGGLRSVLGWFARGRS